MPTRRPSSAAAAPLSLEDLSRDLQQFIGRYQELERENQSLKAQLQAAAAERKAAQAEHTVQVTLLQAEAAALCLGAAHSSGISVRPAALTPGDLYRVVTERPGILASLPLLALAVNPTVRGALGIKNLSAVEGYLTDDIVNDIRTIPFISAQNVKISYANNGTIEAEITGWRKAIALVLTLLHHFTPAHEETLKEVSKSCHSLASGGFGDKLEKLRRIYNTKLQHLEQVYKDIMPPSDRCPNYVKLVAFMIIGRMLISM
jgi:cell division septum initiation protein DivIVA